MATVTLDRIQYTRTVSEDLGTGRSATATIVATGTKDAENNVTKSSTINLSTVSNMTEAELSAYQAFIAGLDEIAQELEDAIYVNPSP